MRAMHLDEITENQITMFTPIKDVIRPYNWNSTVHVAYVFEMEMDKYTIERTVYTSLDWLGDVGGLMDILFVIGAFPVMLLQGNGLSFLLLKGLFKREAKEK